MSANWTEKEWREHIEKRRQGSELWQFIHICGSLRLAMVLLLTIPVACAIATIYESKFNAQVAQAYVYKAPWFVFWLGVLCLNLFCVTLTRWPWRPRHRGFIITHYGIIILLVGGVVGQKLGFEASVKLHTDSEPTKQLVINRTIFQMESGLDRLAYKTPFPVNISPPTPEKPKKVAIPHSDLKLLVDDYSEDLVESTELVASPIPKTGPGVALEFSSSMMGQAVPVNLARQPETARSNDFFGRARMELLDALPDRSGAKPPEGAFRETQMVFAKYEPVITGQDGKKSGYRVALVLEGPTPQVIVESPEHHREMFELPSILGKPLALHGDATQIVVKEYWPDMEMQGGKPASKSDQPNNPAILVTLSNDGAGHDAKPLLEIAPSADGGIVYQMSRAGVVQASGKAAQGESFQLGWADWKALVKKVLPDAMLRTRLSPAGESEGAPPASPEQMISGVRARLFDPDAPESSKATGEPVWVPSGRGVVLRLGERTVFLGFGLEVHSLPFTVKLLKFEVPRDEGTDTPSDFRSTVRFTDSETGETLDALIHMNHPASFPAGLWRVVLGRNFKFSQAQWNPQDPGETTLQVLHDPGWPLKWFGSLLICVGIAIMFYFKPAPSKKTAAQARPKTKSQEALS